MEVLCQDFQGLAQLPLRSAGEFSFLRRGKQTKLDACSHKRLLWGVFFLLCLYVEYLTHRLTGTPVVFVLLGQHCEGTSWGWCAVSLGILPWAWIYSRLEASVLNAACKEQFLEADDVAGLSHHSVALLIEGNISLKTRKKPSTHQGRM